MKTLEKVSDFVGKYMAAIVIVVAALSLLFPLTGADPPPIQPESSERIFPRTPCTALHQSAALCSILSGYSFSS